MWNDVIMLVNLDGKYPKNAKTFKIKGKTSTTYHFGKVKVIVEKED